MVEGVQEGPVLVGTFSKKQGFGSSRAGFQQADCSVRPPRRALFFSFIEICSLTSLGRFSAKSVRAWVKTYICDDEVKKKQFLISPMVYRLSRLHLKIPNKPLHSLPLTR